MFESSKKEKFDKNLIYRQCYQSNSTQNTSTRIKYLGLDAHRIDLRGISNFKPPNDKKNNYFLI